MHTHLYCIPTCIAIESRVFQNSLLYRHCFIVLKFNYSINKKYRNTTQSNQRNNQNSKSKDKTITWNKETQMTGQHEHLLKPEVKSGAPEG